MRFLNRMEAGRLLGWRLAPYADREDVLILGLARGGIVVAFEVARMLGDAQLDVFVVRKLGVPGHSELAMGAIASGGFRVLNEKVIQRLRIPDHVVEEVAHREEMELRRRELFYRGDNPPPELGGRTIILVDDGIATGSSMRAAIMAVRKQHPARVVVVVPTAAKSSCQELSNEADEIVAAMTPLSFEGVGEWYEDFSQVTHEDVRELLERARHEGFAAVRLVPW